MTFELGPPRRSYGGENKNDSSPGLSVVRTSPQSFFRRSCRPSVVLPSFFRPSSVVLTLEYEPISGLYICPFYLDARIQLTLFHIKSERIYWPFLW